MQETKPDRGGQKDLIEEINPSKIYQKFRI